MSIRRTNRPPAYIVMKAAACRDEPTPTLDDAYAAYDALAKGNWILPKQKRIGPFGQCHDNARLAVRQWGGEVVFGWFRGTIPARGQVNRFGNIHIGVHAIWREPSGELVDTTGLGSKFCTAPQPPIASPAFQFADNRPLAELLARSMTKSARVWLVPTDRRKSMEYIGISEPELSPAEIFAMHAYADKFYEDKARRAELEYSYSAGVA